MLADWRINQGSDQDLTRLDTAAPVGGTGASPVLNTDGAAAAAAVGAAVGRGSGRSSEAATLNFDERGARCHPNVPQPA